VKLAVVLGTRPETIKMSPIIRECERLHLDYFVLHTGQHYSYELDGVFFEQLNLGKPKYNLGIGSGTHAEMTGLMLLGIEHILFEEQPSIVLVEGDTDSALAGALASVKINVKVGHIEAGLRSYNRLMPEEINRVLIDHCSDLLFAPTDKAKATLLSEGIPATSIFVTGNTIVDAVYQNMQLAPKAFDGREYILVTLHRQENVDSKSRFSSILEGVERIAVDYRVVYPIHPRSRKMMAKFGLKAKNIELIDPLDYLRFLQMEKSAKLIMTDSGGLQEEACILGVPCVTLRDNTELPETIEVGANMLAGASPDKIVECAKTMIDKRNTWSHPFGDGKAGERIVNIVKERYE